MIKTSLRSKTFRLSKLSQAILPFVGNLVCTDRLTFIKTMFHFFHLISVGVRKIILRKIIFRACLFRKVSRINWWLVSMHWRINNSFYKFSEIHNVFQTSGVFLNFLKISETSGFLFSGSTERNKEWINVFANPT